MACFFPEGLGLSRLLGKVFLFGRALLLGRAVKTPPFCVVQSEYLARLLALREFWSAGSFTSTKFTGFVTPITKWAVCGFSTTTQCENGFVRGECKCLSVVISDFYSD